MFDILKLSLSLPLSPLSTSLISSYSLIRCFYTHDGQP